MDRKIPFALRVISKNTKYFEGLWNANLGNKDSIVIVEIKINKSITKNHVFVKIECLLLSLEVHNKMRTAVAVD